jgi:hypothetical protein
MDGELSAWSRRSETGHNNTRYSCAGCGNIIYGADDSGFDLAKLQAGLLDDTSQLEPEIYLFDRSRQPWVALPPTTRPYETQADDAMEMLSRTQTYRDNR